MAEGTEQARRAAANRESKKKPASEIEPAIESERVQAEPPRENLIQRAEKKTPVPERAGNNPELKLLEKQIFRLTTELRIMSDAAQILNEEVKKLRVQPVPAKPKGLWRRLGKALGRASDQPQSALGSETETLQELRLMKDSLTTGIERLSALRASRDTIEAGVYTASELEALRQLRELHLGGLEELPPNLFSELGETAAGEDTVQKEPDLIEQIDRGLLAQKNELLATLLTPKMEQQLGPERISLIVELKNVIHEIEEDYELATKKAEDTFAASTARLGRKGKPLTGEEHSTLLVAISRLKDMKLAAITTKLRKRDEAINKTERALRPLGQPYVEFRTIKGDAYQEAQLEKGLLYEDLQEIKGKFLGGTGRLAA